MHVRLCECHSQQRCNNSIALTVFFWRDFEFLTVAAKARSREFASRKYSLLPSWPFSPLGVSRKCIPFQRRGRGRGCTRKGFYRNSRRCNLLLPFRLEQYVAPAWRYVRSWRNFLEAFLWVRNIFDECSRFVNGTHVHWHRERVRQQQNQHYFRAKMPIWFAFCKSFAISLNFQFQLSFEFRRRTERKRSVVSPTFSQLRSCGQIRFLSHCKHCNMAREKLYIQVVAQKWVKFGMHSIFRFTINRNSRKVASPDATQLCKG